VLQLSLNTARYRRVASTSFRVVEGGPPALVQEGMASDVAYGTGQPQLDKFRLDFSLLEHPIVVPPDGRALFEDKTAPVNGRPAAELSAGAEPCVGAARRLLGKPLTRDVATASRAALSTSPRSPQSSTLAATCVPGRRRNRADAARRRFGPRRLRRNTTCCESRRARPFGASAHPAAGRPYARRRPSCECAPS
jgi:hypothetical protein